jgi:hypothetical protein
VSAVRQAYPDDRFFDQFWESCQANSAKRKAYRTYDDAFRVLDPESWEVLKSKAIEHFRDHRPGLLKQGFFNQLNETFAYRHLVRQGYSAVKMLSEHGRRVPDLRYFVGRRCQHCEVKTMSISEHLGPGDLSSGIEKGVLECLRGPWRGFLQQASRRDQDSDRANRGPRHEWVGLRSGDLGRLCARQLSSLQTGPGVVRWCQRRWGRSHQSRPAFQSPDAPTKRLQPAAHGVIVTAPWLKHGR